MARDPVKARPCLGTFRATVAARSGLACQRWGAARIAGQPPAPLPCIVVVEVINLRARTAKFFRIIEAYDMADNKMIKTVGEHWVCATLARHKWAPALTRDGLERTDVLAVATHLDHRPTIEIQVKTATEGTRLTSWPIGLKAQEIAKSVYEWFVLVLLPTLPAAPRAFVVPRDARVGGNLDRSSALANRSRSYPGTAECRAQPGADSVVCLGEIRRQVGPARHADHRRACSAPLVAPRTRPERVGLPPGHPWAEALPAWG